MHLNMYSRYFNITNVENISFPVKHICGWQKQTEIVYILIICILHNEWHQENEMQTLNVKGYIFCFLLRLGNVL